MSMQKYKERPKKDCAYYFLKLDFEIIKPLLIYKFDKDKMHLADDYAELMLSEANLIGSVYGQIDHNALAGEDELAVRERVTLALSRVIMDRAERKHTISGFMRLPSS